MSTKYRISYEIATLKYTYRTLSDNIDEAFEEALHIAERDPMYVKDSVEITPEEDGGCNPQHGDRLDKVYYGNK